ncbi:MAG: ASTRA complex subunit [Pleopsidium flavum]|nr:MAG: ASTRA complex subunit [Pleopsidium flavum]
MAETSGSSLPTVNKQPLLSPAQPVYVLRGHQAQIHAVQFIRANSRLITGDADGWIVVWALGTKRPAAVWKAHDNAILGVAPWGEDRIITHGRDNKLSVWQLGLAHEAAMDEILPVDDPAMQRKQPWLLHVLSVNALNFCSFAICYDQEAASAVKDQSATSGDVPRPVLVAVPNAIDSGGIDIFLLPTEKRRFTIPGDKSANTGMLMTVNISSEADKLRVIAGYESGHTIVFQRANPNSAWQKLYECQPHSQPILSLDVLPSQNCYFTSSADALIAKHPLAPWKSTVSDSKPLKVVQTKHSGQQGLRVRSDGKIFATAGWDSRIRVYSSKTMNELAVLKWHKEGCYAVAFAEVDLLVSAPSYDAEKQPTNGELATTQRSSALKTVEQQRNEKAQSTHWLAAGSKDGKVSLWDIY